MKRTSKSMPVVSVDNGVLLKALQIRLIQDSARRGRKAASVPVPKKVEHPMWEGLDLPDLGDIRNKDWVVPFPKKSETKAEAEPSGILKRFVDQYVEMKSKEYKVLLDDKTTYRNGDGELARVPSYFEFREPAKPVEPEKRPVVLSGNSARFRSAGAATGGVFRMVKVNVGGAASAPLLPVPQDPNAETEWRKRAESVFGMKVKLEKP